jgi:hypothetical protein
VLALFHPGFDVLLTNPGFELTSENWVRHISTLWGWWLLLHILQLPLFALLGLTVLWMLPAQGRASQVSRYALGVYLVLYPAFDALVGIGSGILLQHRATLPAASQAVLDPAIGRLFFDPSSAAFLIAGVASMAWTVGVVAAAIARWRHGGWRVGLPLILAGLALGFDHSVPFGTLACLFVGLAVWRFLSLEGRAAALPTGVPAPAQVI